MQITQSHSTTGTGAHLRTMAQLPILLLLAVVAPGFAAEAVATGKKGTAQLIAPAVSTGTGLLLEPALTLPASKSHTRP